MASAFSLSNTSVCTKRALIIGNNEYRENSPLRYCINDAENLANKLHEIGFEITAGTNLTCELMDTMIETFKEEINPDDLALFFYAGHGCQWNHLNFLIPIDDDRITTGADLEDRAINVQDTLEKIMNRRPSAAIFLLDYCRNSFVGESSNSNGLSSMRALADSFIGFACDANKVAADESRNGRNGLFTSHLLQHIDQPNLTIDEVMYVVCDGVMKETDDDQCPFRLSSLRRKVYLNQQFTVEQSNDTACAPLDRIDAMYARLDRIDVKTDLILANTQTIINQIKYGPYLRTTFKIAEVLLKLGGFVIPQLDSVSGAVGNGADKILPTPNKQKEMEDQLNLIEKLLDRVDHKWEQPKSTMLEQDNSRGVPLQGPDLREVETYLDVADNKRSLGNLYRTVTTDGHVRWVCLEHYDDISFNNTMSKYIDQLEAMG
ncbi:unnamed protein product, partial [Adineta steineri]